MQVSVNTHFLKITCGVHTEDVLQVTVDVFRSEEDGGSNRGRWGWRMTGKSVAERIQAEKAILTNEHHEMKESGSRTHHKTLGCPITSLIKASSRHRDAGVSSKTWG